jgi:hypothetical protein
MTEFSRQFYLDSQIPTLVLDRFSVLFFLSLAQMLMLPSFKGRRRPLNQKAAIKTKIAHSILKSIVELFLFLILFLN